MTNSERHQVREVPQYNSQCVTSSISPQVWRILKLEQVQSPAENYEVVAGTGERCVPGGPDNCGDGGPATAAKLAFPKGLAVSVDRRVYISDGKTVRMVDQAGRISTLIGGQAHHTTPHTLPLGCDSTYLVSRDQ